MIIIRIIIIIINEKLNDVIKCYLRYILNREKLCVYIYIYIRNKNVIRHDIKHV